MHSLLVFFWSLLSAAQPASLPGTVPNTAPERTQQNCRIVRLEHPNVRRFEVSYGKNGVQTVLFQKWDFDQLAYRTVQIGQYVYLNDGRLDRIDLFEPREGKEVFLYTLCRLDHRKNMAALIQKTDEETPAMNVNLYFGAGGEVRKVEAQGENGAIELPLHSRADGRMDSLMVPNGERLRFEYDREKNPFRGTYLGLFLRDRGNYSLFMNFPPNNLTGVFAGTGVQDAFAISYGYDDNGRVTRLSMEEYHYLITYEGDCP
jgi:hypothetical protein